MRILKLPAQYYEQFDADYLRDIPAEGCGGWKEAEVELDLDHTAVVIMHAWDTGTMEQFPGWYRACEEIPRAQAIAGKVFPKLLGAVRRRQINLLHVAGGGDYYQRYPGYRKAVSLAVPDAACESIATDPTRQALDEFRGAHGFPGRHNRADCQRGFSRIDFDPRAIPEGEEIVAATSGQLFGVCRSLGINHLIYAGFCIDWCLLMSPGGMLDMSRHGIMCSAFRQAVAAVENKETARVELGKQIGLWRVAVQFGFVFDVDVFVKAVAGAG